MGSRLCNGFVSNWLFASAVGGSPYSVNNQFPQTFPIIRKPALDGFKAANKDDASRRGQFTFR
jgi:hypothetical protein